MSLAKLMDEYLSEEEVCDFLGVKRNTMQARRSRGERHPPFVRFGTVVKYPRKEFHAWVERHKVWRSLDDGK